MAEIDDVVKVAREAPPKQMVTDQRYWDWHARLVAALDAYDAARGSTPEGAP